MKSLYESILDNDFDVKLDIMSIFGLPKQSTWAGERDFGFELKSSDGYKLVDTMILAIEAEGAKEKSYSAVMSALRQGKCAMFVTPYQDHKDHVIYLVTKPDPKQKSNINSVPFLSIYIQPLYGDRQNTKVRTEAMRGPGGICGLPDKNYTEKAYVIPNQLYAKLLRYVVDNSKNNSPTNWDIEAIKNRHYEICDTVNKR